MPEPLRSSLSASLLIAFFAILLVVAKPSGSPRLSVDDDFLYIPGTMGIDPVSGQLAEGVAGQVRQAMENVDNVLREQGLDFSQVVSVNVFLSETRYFPEMNEVYRPYFPVEPPTRATVGVDLPMPGALVQIAMVVARPNVTRRVIQPAELKSPDLPYSWGILAGETLFMSGITSRDPETYAPVAGDIVTETRRVFGNMGAVLKAAKMDYDNLASCTVFMNDPHEFSAMNETYGAYFSDDPPARTTVRAGLMNPAFGVEIQCVAQRGPERSAVMAKGAAAPESPYSPAIQVSNRVFTAGTIGSGPGGLAKGDIETQTRQTLANLRATLAAAQVDFNSVNVVYVFVPHILHAPSVNGLLDELIGSRPSRTLIGADLVSPDALVEITMVANGG
jgi:2-iminobutanoate/2-iminopropanoate deaminase